jgi:hypothetical protein
VSQREYVIPYDRVFEQDRSPYLLRMRSSARRYKGFSLSRFTVLAFYPAGVATVRVERKHCSEFSTLTIPNNNLFI